MKKLEFYYSVFRNMEYLAKAMNERYGSQGWMIGAVLPTGKDDQIEAILQRFK